MSTSTPLDSSFSHRLHELILVHFDGNFSRFCRSADLPRYVASSWLSGAGTPTSEHVRHLSAKTGCNHEWLERGIGPMVSTEHSNG